MRTARSEKATAAQPSTRAPQVRNYCASQPGPPARPAARPRLLRRPGIGCCSPRPLVTVPGSESPGHTPADSAASARRSAGPGPATLTFSWSVARHSLGVRWASGPARVGGRCGNYHLAECSAIRSVAFLRLQRTAVATAVLYRASPRDAREDNI